MDLPMSWLSSSSNNGNSCAFVRRYTQTCSNPCQSNLAGPLHSDAIKTIRWEAGGAITLKERKPTNPNCTNAGNKHTYIHTYWPDGRWKPDLPIWCLFIDHICTLAPKLYCQNTILQYCMQWIEKAHQSTCPIVFLKQFYILTNHAYKAHGFLTVCRETIFYVPYTYATRGLIGALDWNQKYLVVFFNLFFTKNWRNASVVAPWKCILTE
jgi:hypothetical protein